MPETATGTHDEKSSAVSVGVTAGVRPTAIYNLALAVSEGQYRTGDFAPSKLTAELLSRLKVQSSMERTAFRQAISRLTVLRSEEFPRWNAMLDNWLEDK